MDGRVNVILLKGVQNQHDAVGVNQYMQSGPAADIGGFVLYFDPNIQWGSSV